MQKEKNRLSGKRYLWTGILILLLFGVWTIMIQYIDVRCVGETGMDVGFATFNGWFHQWTGVHMTLYTITDWLGLVPVFICMIFGCIGLVQMIQRKSLFKVDLDLILLGVYYVLVIFSYLFFEMVPMNYRPIFIDGRLEASYPSSTTLLVLSVMPTLIFQAEHRMGNVKMKHIIRVFTILFSMFMVLGRLVSGVHWFTDIIGAILLSTGLFCVYKAVVIFCWKEEK